MPLHLRTTFNAQQVDDVTDAVFAYEVSAGRKLDPQTFATQCVSSFFGLLPELLRDDLNIAHALRSHLLGMAGVLLRQNKLATFGVEALLAMQSLLERASPQAEFVRAVCKQLLFDFDLWRGSDFSVRVGHIQVMATLVKNHASFFRRHYGVQFLLDVLRNSAQAREVSSRPPGAGLGGSSNAANRSGGLNPGGGPGSRAASVSASAASVMQAARGAAALAGSTSSSVSDNSRLAASDDGQERKQTRRLQSFGVAHRSRASFSQARQEEKDMRSAIFNLVRVYLERGVELHEARSLVSFLLTCEDNLILEEALEGTLLSLKASLDGLTVGKSFLAALTADGPPLVLYGLLQRTNNRLRAGECVEERIVGK